MIEYKIIRAGDIDELEKRVNEALHSGWTPCGSPSTGYNIYMQAMTKQEPGIDSLA